MKLRRFMQNCPSRTKPTKGQRCASQQNWLPNAAMGQSLQIDTPGAARAMSALPPIATGLMRHSETSRCARSGLMRRSK